MSLSTSLWCRGPLLPDRRVHPRFSKPNQGFKGLTTGGVQRLPRGRIGNWVHIGARFGSEIEQTAQPSKAKQHTRTAHCGGQRHSQLPPCRSSRAAHHDGGGVFRMMKQGGGAQLRVGDGHDMRKSCFGRGNQEKLTTAMAPAAPAAPAATATARLT